MPKPDPNTAMISSTARDLPDHRSKVRDACLSLSFRPIMMEYLAGQDRSALGVSIGMVEEAGIYLGIIAHCYGSCPDDDPRSYTEIEFDNAVKLGIPIIPFFMHDDHPWRASLVDKGDAAQKLERLKNKVQQGRIVKWFKSPEDLYGKVIQALSEHKHREQDSPGEAWTSHYPKLLLKSPLLEIDRLRRQLHAVTDLYEEWRVTLPEGEHSYSSLANAVRDHPKLSLVGRAGSGKTIALKQLLRSAAKEAADDPIALRPVWIQASEFSADPPDVTAMENLVTQQVLEVTHNSLLTEAHVREAIASGRCLFLLDGLDELPRKQWKQRLQSVLGFFQTYQANRVVITTRPGLVPLQAGIPELPMPAMNAIAQRKLVTVLTLQDPRASAMFHSWLEGHPAMKQIADTPFFLHVLVECFRKNPEAAPEHPAALLVEVLKRRLIEEYSSHTNTGCWRRLSDDGWQDDDLLEIGLPVLARLGFETLKSEIPTRLPIGTALALQQRVPVGAGPKDTFIHSASGLEIYSLNAGELVFPHVLWRDLLAAYELSLQLAVNPASSLPALEAGANSPWKQAAVFLSQLLPPAGLRSCYRQWCASSPQFTAAVVAEGAEVGDASVTAELRAEFRAEIARATNNLGGRRLAAHALSCVGDDRLWEDPLRPLVPALAKIPAGTYRVGLSQADLRKLFPLQDTVELEFADEEFQCSSEALRAFAISRYPVANVQFRRFIEQGGYSDPAWWDEPAWQWLQDNGAGRRRPDHWNDWRHNLTNQPVVGITYYEAAAYARWLSATAAGGHTFRLPTVAEWQAACRGIDGRLYPWGDDPAPARCNCWHAEDLGVPSSVGIYVDGATPEGVCDLAGNIAEWTSSIDSGDPVVSGGSWFQSIHRSRATQLRSVGPGVSSTEVGFRVVAP